MSPVVEVSADDGVLTITLNRPDRLNAIDLAMTRALEAALAAALRDESVYALLLCGAGRAFSAGDDIDEQARICAAGETALREQLALLQRISEHLLFGNKPSVAAVRGWAIGAGFSWTLNCDFAVWAEGAVGFLPEVTLGTHITGAASFLVPLMAGSRRARAMLSLGRRLGTAEAAEWGIASHVASDTALEVTAGALAAELAALPVQAAQFMRRSLCGQHEAALRQALANEIEACVATTLAPATIQRMRDAVAKAR